MQNIQSIRVTPDHMRLPCEGGGAALPLRNTPATCVYGLLCRVLALCPVRIRARISDRLVDENVAITNLHIEPALRVCTHPGLELDGRALASKVTQWYQFPGSTLAASWEFILHAARPLPITVAHSSPFLRS